MAFRIKVGLNTTEYSVGLRAADERMRQFVRAGVDAVAIEAREQMRSRVPPGAISHGLVNPFPDVMGTGRLRSYIIAGKTYAVTSDKFSAKVGLSDRAPKRVKSYAHAHEVGMTIYPKKAKVMHFWYMGKEYFAKSVRIKRKGYMAASWRVMNKDFQKLAEDHIRDLMKSASLSFAPNDPRVR